MYVDFSGLTVDREVAGQPLVRSRVFILFAQQEKIMHLLLADCATVDNENDFNLSI